MELPLYLPLIRSHNHLPLQTWRNDAPKIHTHITYIHTYMYVCLYISTQPRVSHAELYVAPRPTRTPALPMYRPGAKRRKNTNTQMANPSIYSTALQSIHPPRRQAKALFRNLVRALQAASAWLSEGLSCVSLRRRLFDSLHVGI